ncbi:MAG: IS1595 family transposase [Bacteroidetes bacterium]|nr:IS1595 family transposase [Bacteroidota bacterium]
MKYTINQFRKDYPNDDVCLDAIFAMRWGKQPCCPGCSQQTTFKRIPGRRCYQCSDKDCQYQLYPTAGTVFEKTRTSLVDWFYAIYLMTSTRNGVAAKELQRQLGVTYKCAHRMGHQIRKLMGSPDGLLTGVVEIDEVYIGGDRKNKSKSIRSGSKIKGYMEKTPVLTLLQRDGNIISKVLDVSTGDTIRPVVLDNVAPGSQIITDGFKAYMTLEKTYKHEIINHAIDEWGRGIFHTNTVEGFFSHLKRTIKGTHISVSRQHLQKYADECAFRYTHRHEGQLMFHTILGRVVR